MARKISEVAPDAVMQLSCPPDKRRSLIIEILRSEERAQKMCESLGSVEELCDSTAESESKVARLIRGAALYLLFHRLSTAPESQRDAAAITKLLAVEDLWFFIHDFYEIPDRHDFHGAELHATGTTSLILKGTSGGHLRALKLIQAPYLELPSIREATGKYLKIFSLAAAYSAPIEACGETWILMEFIKGHNLSEFMKRLRAHTRYGTDGPAKRRHMPDEYVSAVAEIFGRITEALNYCATRPRPIFHGDLNPLNVMVECDDLEIKSVKLIDFGPNYVLIDRLGNRRAFVEVFSRTDLFMPPELISSHGEPSMRSDLYSLGMIGLELLSPAPLDKAGVGKRLQEIWERPSTVGIAQIIEDLIDEDPNERLLLLRDREPSEIYRSLDGLLKGQVAHYNALVGQAKEDVSLRALLTKLDVWRAAINIWSTVRERARPYNEITRGQDIAARVNALAQTVIVMAALAYTIVDARIYFDLQTILPLQWLQELIQLFPKRFEIGDLEGNWPGRAVALTFGLVAARYYANIFAPLRIADARAPSEMFVNAWIRFNSFSYFAPIMVAIVYAPHWWPYCTLIGALVTTFNNYFCWRVANASAADARRSFASVEKYHENETSQFLDKFREWARLMLGYSIGIGGIGVLLTIGRAHDEWVYALLVSLINMIQLYRNNCGNEAPYIAGHLSRLFFYMRRRALGQERSLAT